MENIFLDILIAVLIAVFSSFITSLVTFKLALAKYQNEKRWESKVKSYQILLEALSDSSRAINAVINNERGNVKTSKEYMEEQLKIHDNSQYKITRFIDVGSFLISDKAETRLKLYESKVATSNNEDSVKFLEAVKSETSQCIKDLKLLAKEDLK